MKADISQTGHPIRSVFGSS